jgi:hypothetical protein
MICRPIGQRDLPSLHQTKSFAQFINRGGWVGDFGNRKAKKTGVPIQSFKKLHAVVSFVQNRPDLESAFSAGLTGFTIHCNGEMHQDLDGIHAECCSFFSGLVHAPSNREMRIKNRQFRFPTIVVYTGNNRLNSTMPLKDLPASVDATSM